MGSSVADAGTWTNTNIPITIWVKHDVRWVLFWVVWVDVRKQGVPKYRVGWDLHWKSSPAGRYLETHGFPWQQNGRVCSVGLLRRWRSRRYYDFDKIVALIERALSKDQPAIGLE